MASATAKAETGKVASEVGNVRALSCAQAVGQWRRRSMVQVDHAEAWKDRLEQIRQEKSHVPGSRCPRQKITGSIGPSMRSCVEARQLGQS
jgi:hypothetical protein